MNMIDLKKPIKFASEQTTKSGWAVTVITDKGLGPYPLLGVATNPRTNTAFPLRWSAAGTGGNEGNRWASPKYWDICNEPEKIKVDVWLNIFVVPTGQIITKLHSSQAAANLCETIDFYDNITTRCACLHVEAVVEPGFGITPPAEPQSC